MSECLVTGCEREGMVEVTLRLPPVLHDGSMLAEDARTQTVRICDGHPDLLEPTTALHRLSLAAAPPRGDGRTMSGEWVLMDRLALRALAEGPRSMRPVYPKWSDVLALLDRLDAAEELLREADDARLNTGEPT